MPNLSVQEKMNRVQEKIERIKNEIEKLNKEKDEDVQKLENIFSKKMVIDECSSEVVGYSIKENRIEVKVVPPDSGVYTLVLTFEKFAEIVSFPDGNPV